MASTKPMYAKSVPGSEPLGFGTGAAVAGRANAYSPPSSVATNNLVSSMTGGEGWPLKIGAVQAGSHVTPLVPQCAAYAKR
jgi:hypothetical protein